MDGPQTSPSWYQKAPPDWVLEPATAWIYLVVAVPLALTPVWPLGWALAIVAAIFAFMERRASGLPAFWWVVAVVLFGPLGYLFFIYKRSRGAVMYKPEEAITEQARMAKALPPRQAATQTQGRAAPADWYSDPTGNARLRYWNGSEWTDHTAT